MIEKPKAGRGEIRRFGILFAVLSALAGVFMLWKGSREMWIPFMLAAVFLLTGLVLPSVLRPFYVAWMRFAFILAWINTHLLLSVFYFLILTPIGVVMRLLGKDVLGKKMDRSAATYWVKRNPEPNAKESYRHLF